jgi:hypothetical protein
VTREEFVGLPPAVALALLYDASPGIQKLVEAAEKPVIPRSPKWDTKLPRKGGYAWASECSLEDLSYWHAKKVEGAQSGSQWAEKDAKLADKLSFWIAWRRVEPTAAWSGQRGDDNITARAPAGKATVYPWPDRGEVTTPLQGDDFGSGNDEDDLPFIHNVTCEPGERWWKF